MNIKRESALKNRLDGPDNRSRHHSKVHTYTEHKTFSHDKYSVYTTRVSR